MANIIKTIAKVDPKAVYNIDQIRRLGLFPWLKPTNHHSHRDVVLNDRLGDNMLRTRITGEGKGRDYKIRGENLVKFLQKRHENEKGKKGESDGKEKA